MHDDGMPNHAEYTVMQKAEGRFLHLRILLITLYFLFAIAYVTASLIIGIVQIIAILPLLLWILAHFTWRYVSLEHSMTISEGTLTVTDILKDGKRIERLKIILAKAESLSELPIKTPPNVTLYDFRGDKNASGAYCITFKENDKTAILFLRTTPEFLRILKRFIKNS